MKIFLIADVHSGENKWLEKKDPAAPYKGTYGLLFPSFQTGMRELTAGCDLIVNLGDLIENTSGEAKSADMDEERYRTAMRVLDGDVPVRHVLGNHDLINMKRDRAARLIGEHAIRYSFDLGGYHHVVLDGNREGKGWPESFQFDEEQIEWLAEDLRKAILPVIVYSHYPISSYDVSDNPLFNRLEYGMAFPLRAERILETIEKSGKVLTVMSGHMHFGHQHIQNEILHFTLGSFTQNDGHAKPTTEYAIAEITGNTVSVKTGRII